MAADRPAEQPQPGEPPRGTISPRLTEITRIVHGLRVPNYQQLAQRGYIVAFNDVRGRFNSDGVFQPYFNEADDGHDTVEWIAAQEWCDGNIGMLGGSYAGQTQWYAASRKPPHLKAIVPVSSPPGSLWRNEPIFGGCFMLVGAEWMVGMGVRSWQVTDFANVFTRQQPYFEALPLSALPELAGTGWWDLNFPGAPLNFEAMRDNPAADRQKLIIELNHYIIRFFDRWLKGMRNSIEDEKPVYVFVTGANEWWAEDDWPPPDAQEVPFYFHSRGHANSLKGDGSLSVEPPGEEPPDEYRYDPADQNRIAWSLQEGPIDDRLATIRDDVLCYTSEPLTEPLDVVGWVTCVLYASSSARDTDWHVRLVDVHPDGSARFLCRGALRARFRGSFAEPALLQPGEPTPFEITMDACGVRFLPGHRIRVEVTSSWFTQYDRNTNSGADNLILR